MPDLLLELFSEDIPARMQPRAAEDLRKLVTGHLVDAGLRYEDAKAFVTPRRLALAVKGVPVKQPDRIENKKGPSTEAPKENIEAFLKSVALYSVDQLEVQEIKKRRYYVASLRKIGRPSLDIIAEFLPEIIRNFPWPKSMRWGAPKVSSLVTESGDSIIT